MDEGYPKPNPLTPVSQSGMGKRVLIIDDSRATGPLIKMLEQAGHDCIHVRGPLKLQSHLEGHSPHLVIWAENGENPELSKDLADILNRQPEIPLIHFFPDVSAKEHHLTHPAKYLKALPISSDLSEQWSLVGIMLGQPAANGEEIPPPRSELAFRNVFTRSDHGKAAREKPGFPHSEQDALGSTSTALNPVERTMLTLHSPSGSGNNSLVQHWGFQIRKWLPFIPSRGTKSPNKT